MCIAISTVRIAGFRGIKNLEITLALKTVILGQNNSGKTSLLNALQLALGEYSRSLSEEDFYIDGGQPRCEAILVDLKIVPLTEDGAQTQIFNPDWTNEFGDVITRDISGNEFVALRTRVKSNVIKDGFETTRETLTEWPNLEDWSTAKVNFTKLKKRWDFLPLYAIDAHRDIHQDIRERSSFIGKVVSNVKYNPTDITDLEARIKEVNNEAVEKSEDLEELRIQLEKLTLCFSGPGSVEITPFAKRIRDLNKHFSVHYGNTPVNSFSMEYHGMGTRSWASILAASAFINVKSKRHSKECKPFFPVVTVEEPENHLHPNAQKSLYNQLAGFKGQVIISTHSPYLAAVVECNDIRSLHKTGDNIEVSRLSAFTDPDDLRTLQREVIHSRGEILFSSALIICEGETEEQVLPLLFEKYFGTEPFTLGVNIIGVGGSGRKYLPFLTFARDFKIPIYIFSDGEAKTVKNLKECYESVFGAIQDIYTHSNITILRGTDFEEYLISAGFSAHLEDAITDLDGPTKIVDWVRTKDGLPAGRKASNKPKCQLCNQAIYEDVLRDYKGTTGYNQVLCDIIDKKKPKYAPVIAQKLCALEPQNFPSLIVDFFEKVKIGMKI